MKKLTINKNSWHFWIVKHWMGVEADQFKSICTYFWALMLFIVLSISGLAIAAIGIMFICALLYTWPWLILVPVGTYILFDIIAMIYDKKQEVWRQRRAEYEDEWYAAYWRGDDFKVWYRENVLKQKPKEPNIFVEWYRSFKEKTCVMIEFKD